MSEAPEQNNAKRTVPGVFVWDMVRKALRAAEEGVFCWLFENDEILPTQLGYHNVYDHEVMVRFDFYGYIDGKNWIWIDHIYYR